MQFAIFGLISCQRLCFEIKRMFKLGGQAPATFLLAVAAAHKFDAMWRMLGTD